MTNLFKSFEVADYFKDTIGIPKPTLSNWSKEKGTWRARLYFMLEKRMLEELAEKAKEL